MGYRSDMVIGIPKKKVKAFEKLLIKYFPDSDVFVRKNLNETRYNKNIAIYEGLYLKWYPSYEDVKAIEKFVNDCWDKDDVNSFLVGLGEDGEIHSEIGDYFDYVGVYTTYEIYDMSMEDRIKEQNSIWKKSYFKSTETTI
mgnify:FL=1